MPVAPANRRHASPAPVRPLLRVVVPTGSPATGGSDPNAFATAVLPPLVATLRRRMPAPPDDVLQDAATEAVLVYLDYLAGAPPDARAFWFLVGHAADAAAAATEAADQRAAYEVPLTRARRALDDQAVRDAAVPLARVLDLAPPGKRTSGHRAQRRAF